MRQQLQDTGENGAEDSGENEKGDVMVDKEEKETSLKNVQQNVQGFRQICDVPDQSECFSAEKKLLSVNLENNDVIKEKTLKGNFLVNNNKILFQNSTGASTIMSDSLGSVESLPAYLEHLEDNEESAWDLQGMIFSDGDLGWCLITG